MEQQIVFQQEIQNRKIITSGIETLDQVFDSFLPSELTIIAGAIRMGKTSLMLSMIEDMSYNQEIELGVISMAVDQSSWIERFLFMSAGVPFCKRNSLESLSNEELQLLKQSKESFVQNTYPINIIDPIGISIKEIEELCHNMLDGNNVKILFIDSIQFIYPQAEDLIIKLKQCARKFNIPIVAISRVEIDRVSRLGYDEMKPRIEDLDHYDICQQFADKIVMLHRPEYYGFRTNDEGLSTKNLVEVYIENCSTKESNSCQLYLNKITLRIDSKNDKDEEPI